MPKFDNNLNLGLRGLRLSPAEPELLRTQPEIIRTARERGNVSVLLPMVLGEEDLRRAVEHVEHVSREEAGDLDVAVGAMVPLVDSFALEAGT
ncbi:MAG: hypothetical protein J7M14_06765 [Planctomycetes bacterium]|nr:hypothetical protein [Planctomycetota bacterium]